MEANKLSETTQRYTPRSIAPIVAEFEIAERKVVSVADIAEALGVARSNRRVYDAVHTLTQLGWLQPLPARGTYEFLPARGGPYPGGDPLVTARGVLAKRPDFRLAVIGTGAAFLRGFAERAPREYAVAIDRDQGGSVALASVYKVVKTTADRLQGVPSLEGIPVSDATRLLVDAALWPSTCGDLREASHWLRRALGASDPSSAAAAAARLGTAPAARMAYIADKFGAPSVAAAVANTLSERAKTAIGETSSPIVARDPRLGVSDHIGVGSRG